MHVSLSDSNMQTTRSRHIVMGQEGHLELQSKNLKNDISTWLDAFIISFLTPHILPLLFFLLFVLKRAGQYCHIHL
jgi:hypothetical protein